MHLLSIKSRIASLLCVSTGEAAKQSLVLFPYALVIAKKLPGQPAITCWATNQWEPYGTYNSIHHDSITT